MVCGDAAALTGSMRIFVAPELLEAGELTVLRDNHHYLSRVRRARTGDAVQLIDGAGRCADAVIVRIGEHETVLSVSTPHDVPARPPFIRALIPLIKGDRMDSCIEKLVEVGVDAIVLWPAARSIVRLDAERRGARLAKFQLAVQAAARQCGRAQLPTVGWADDLAAAIRAAPAGLHLVLDPTSDDELTGPIADDVTIVSGPEGGLAPEELDQLRPFRAIGLGPRVLRAETAPVVAVAVIRAMTRS
ncbi:MAG: 16S rRNA (uracil(1498)-N(3))-methyltransferase [Kofleriaceae bacterium]